MKTKPITKWAIKWHSKNPEDGEMVRMLNQFYIPVMFNTRQQTRNYINNNYLKSDYPRSDFKKAQGWTWKRPIPIKVLINEI